LFLFLNWKLNVENWKLIYFYNFQLSIVNFQLFCCSTYSCFFSVCQRTFINWKLKVESWKLTLNYQLSIIYFHSKCSTEKKVSISFWFFENLKVFFNFQLSIFNFQLRQLAPERRCSSRTFRYGYLVTT